MLHVLGTALFSLGCIAFVTAVVCKLIVVYRMFQNEEVVLAVLCVLLGPVGIGSFLAYLFGWLGFREYECFNVMLTWTIAMPIFVVFMLLTDMVAPELLQK